MRYLILAVALTTALTTPAFAHPEDECRSTTRTAAVEADIVETAIAAGQFTTLVSAVDAAGLVDTLRSDGPFTVFAPVDSAFAQLPDGELHRLLRRENRHELADLLKLHVVPGAITSDRLQGRILSVDTASGDSVLIDATDGVRVGNAQVIQADIATSNGVIHIIDRVIIPTS